MCRTDEEKYEIFQKSHIGEDGKTHKGINSTINAVHDGYYWKGTTKDVERWVSI